MFNIKMTAMACTPPRTKIEYMMCKLELAVCKTIHRCLWAAASMAQERGSHEIVVEDVFKAVNMFAGLSHLRCCKGDHEQSELRFQLKFTVVARYSNQILPKGGTST